MHWPACLLVVGFFLFFFFFMFFFFCFLLFFVAKDSLGIRIRTVYSLWPDYTYSRYEAQQLQFTWGIYIYLTKKKYCLQDTCSSHHYIPSWLCKCALVWLPQYLLDRLQHVQNSAARLISRSRKHEQLTPALIDVHWLPVPLRIHYKVLLYTYIRQCRVQRHGHPTYVTSLD